MSATIEYKGVVTNVPTGKSAVIRCNGDKMEDEVVVTAGGAEGFPIEIDTLDNALLTQENAGKVYKCDDKLYQVEKITSLKGLTIKFNEHITPCPVIGEDDVFECSGMLMGDDLSPSYGYRPATTAIRKLTDNIIAFESENYDFIHYYETDSIWLATDMNGNTFEALAPAVIYNFNCPALNENPEFIEWVFANGKVYPNFESPNQIKSFILNQSFPYGQNFSDAFLVYMWEVNRTGLFFEFDVAGQFTATFLVNGELITKTFTNVNVNESNNYWPVFTNGDDNLVFPFCVVDEDGNIYDVNGNLLASAIKYNNIYLEDGIEFTEFDCMPNTKTKNMLSFILSYTTVSGEYHNGYAFKDYVVSKEYDGTVEVE